MKQIYPGRFGLPHGDAPGSRFDAMKKMDQIEEVNAGIAVATARLNDEDMDHFLSSRRDPNGAEISQNQACWVY